MTYRELINICYHKDDCNDCEHSVLCEVFKADTNEYYPFQLYKLLHLMEIDYDAEIEDEAVVIPDGVTIIGAWAFEDCKRLKNVNIPNSVTSIGNGAFYGCSSLETITIPDSVTSIGDYAFCNCSKLRSIIILDSVTKIGWCPFYKCGNLTVHCKKGSYAEHYCIENWISYEIVEESDLH